MDNKAYEIASETYRLEHTRWNQNSLLFLGIIASILWSIQYTKDFVPHALDFVFADVVAVFWLSAILSNRSTSYAWLETLKQIEMDTTLKSPYAIQDKIRKDFSLIKDFLSNFGIVPQNGSDKKRFLLFMAVTRVYQGLALTLIVIFTFLSVQEFSTTSKNASLRILGDKLVESEVKHLFADATIIDASGPIALNDKELLIQVRISQQSGYQRLLTWHLNTARMVVSGPDTLSNP